MTPDQLYSWNTVLGSGGSNCDTVVLLGYYYCVAATPPVVPPPTQAGIASNCNKYKIVQCGDYCSKFAQDSADDQYVCGNLYWGVGATIVIPNFSWDITIVLLSAARYVQRFRIFTLVI